MTDKVYILFQKRNACFPTSPKVRDIYIDGKAARKEAKRLNLSPYTWSNFWVESKKVKQQ
jgi:hypothetical protein